MRSEEEFEKFISEELKEYACRAEVPARCKAEIDARIIAAESSLDPPPHSPMITGTPSRRTTYWSRSVN